MLYIFDNTETLITTLPKGSFFDAIHREVLNGENTFQFSFPGNQKEAQYIIEGNLVAFRDLDSYWQVFEVKRIVDVHGDGLTRTAYCEHIFYELLDDIVIDKRPSADATAALAGMLDGTRWQVGIVDNLGTASTSAYYISALEAVQKVAEAWQGELNWRCVINGGVITRYVDLRAMVGTDTGKQFVYSKDILNIEREVDSSSVVTALYGRGKGIELESGSYGRRLTFANVVVADKPAGQEWIGDDDALSRWGRNGRHRFDVFIDEEETDPEVLLQKTRDELARRKIPRVTYRLDVVSLEQLTGYEHEKVRKGDLVRVIDREFEPELVVSARVIEIERDILDPANTKVVLGSFAPTIIEATINTARRVDQMANRPFNTKWLDGKISVLQNEIENVQSYVFQTADDGILVLDAPTYDQATKAMKLGGGIFAIANQKDGQGGWNWRTFGDGSGFTADLITAGMIDAGLVQIGPQTTFAPGYDPTQISVEAAATMGVDSDCLGLWHFDGSLNSHKGVSAIGDESFDTGCFGQAVKVEGEPTTNLAHHPSDTAWWNAGSLPGYAPGPDITYDSAQEAIKVSAHSASYNGHSFLLPIVRDEYFTISANIRNVKGALYPAVHLTLFDNSNSHVISNYVPDILVDDNWGGHNSVDFAPARLTFKIPSGVHPTATKYTIQLVGQGSSACEIYLKDIQLEQKAYPTAWAGYNTSRLGVLKAPTTGLSPSQGTINFRAKNLSASANGSVLVDLPKSDNTQGIQAGIANDGKIFLSDSDKVSKSYTETTQADFQSGTLADVTASSTGNLELNFQYVDISTTDGAISGGDFSTNTKDKAFNNNDSDLANAWYSAQGGDAVSGVAFIGQNFGSAKTIKRIRIKQHELAVYAISSVKLQRSSDGVIWTDVQIIDLNIDGNWQTIDIVANLSAQYWRLLANANTTYSYWAVYEIEMMEMQYKTSGTREKIVDLSGANPAGGTKIEWSSTTPTGTSVTVETALSTDGGNTYGPWLEAINGGSIPGIASDTDLSNAKLKIKETLSTTDTSVTPRLHSLSFTIWEKQASTVYGPNKSTLTAWDSISLAWKSDRLSLVVNDSEACYIENPGLPTAFGSYVYIGTDRNGANAINTLVDELRIDKVYRDVNIRTGWHKAGVPFYTSEDMKQWPGYLKAETDGWKVYDSFGNLRGVMGSWMYEAIRKYGIKIIEGLILATEIRTGAEDAKTYITLKPAPNNAFEMWSEINGVSTKTFSIASAAGSDTARIDFYMGGQWAGYVGMSADKQITLLPLLVNPKTGLKENWLGGDKTEVGGDLHVAGSISKSGSLNYVEPTQNYGTRLLNAVEAPELKYYDSGVTYLENGEAIVLFDPIFLEVIEPDTELTPWQIWVECYGENGVYVSEVGADYFKVKERNGGTSNNKVIWRFEAIRKNYAGIRLMEVV